MAMANLLIPITEGISGFFRWWGGEMAAVLPVGLRARLGRGGQRLTIEISEQRALFGFEKGRETRALGEVTVSPAGLAGQRDAGQREAVARIIRDAGVRTAEVVLRLPRDKVLRRLVDLPAAAAFILPAGDGCRISEIQYQRSLILTHRDRAGDPPALRKALTMPRIACDLPPARPWPDG